MRWVESWRRGCEEFADEKMDMEKENGHGERKRTYRKIDAVCAEPPCERTCIWPWTEIQQRVYSAKRRHSQPVINLLLLLLLPLGKSRLSSATPVREHPPYHSLCRSHQRPGNIRTHKHPRPQSSRCSKSALPLHRIFNYLT